jgi:RecA/RadA recombinase
LDPFGNSTHAKNENIYAAPMPTFQSIGIHPELRTRLVTESKNGDVQVVRTPQALLSRNPTALRLLHNHNGDGNSCETRPIALRQVQKLRMDVATEMIAQSRTGRRLQDIARMATTHRQQRERATTTTISRRRNRTRNRQRSKQFAIPGTIPALTLLEFEAATTKSYEREHHRQQHYALPTRCRKLDYALALPNEHQNASTSMDMSSKTHAGSDSISSSNTDSSYAGIPFGYVTQFSGCPGSGKTQLALHLAATASSGNVAATVWYLHSSSASVTPQVERLSELCVGGKYSALHRIRFVHVPDAYRVLSALAVVEDSLLQQQQQGGCDGEVTGTSTTAAATTELWKPVLLVLDSCSGCLSADGLQEAVGSTIKRLTRHYRLATVLLNGTVANYNGGGAKPALGQRWNAIPDVSVWLEPAYAAPNNAAVPVMQATVIQHSAKPCTKSNVPVGKFRITKHGILDVP